MPAPPPDPKKLAMALHLRRSEPDLSLRQIAERIGVNSPTTVSNYIAMAEAHEQWIPAVNRAAIGARWDLVAGTVMDRLLKRLDDPEAETEKVARAIADYLGLIAKRHGLFAPTKTENVNTDAAPAPDPKMTAEIQAALAELDRLDREGGHDDAGD
jgi:transcriptional regulator with XRE-family HTH domain